MRITALLLLLAVLLLNGCQERDQRAQAAADLDAGIQASIEAIADNATADAIAILSGASKYVAPAAGVPRAELPTPRMAPAFIRSNPAAYGDAAPPDPTPGWHFWASVGGVGMLALMGLRVAAPFIPGGGPLVKVVADTAWNLMAHSDQKKADAANEAMADAARTVQPLLDALASPEAKAALPAKVLDSLNDPRIRQAVDLLATGKV